MATSRSSVGRDLSLRKDVGVGPPFERVLIANRGEIAVRLIRACHELGMEAVAIYSDVDAEAKHVRLADRAIRIGPPTPSMSYLRIDAIIEAMLESRADAVHPGYGFLAERAAFARAVVEAGSTFVGPTAESIDALGDKLNARRLARSVNVDPVPGSLEAAVVERPDQFDAVAAEASAIGFPLLIKAAAGGGGRGMRRVESVDGLREALLAGSREATAAFGDGSVYLEREIRPARHIEVQLLGDAEGSVIALGERDCSLQRRHQKLVEEAPAPGLTADERADLHDRAVRVARAGGLRNAATAEFLRTPDGRLYFLEINARLQVEHGVSELLSGFDIVHEQFALAAGRPLSPAARAAARRAAKPTSHVIEVRLSAEDPGRDFEPTPGTVARWSMPGGPGIRVDTAIEAGDRIPTEYDNLVAKIIVQAGDRGSAIDRLRRALDETDVIGIQTTLPFHRFVARDPSFRDGAISTDWVGEHWDGPAAFREAARTALEAAGLAAIERPAMVSTLSGNSVPEHSATGSAIPGGAAGGSTGSPWGRAGRASAVNRWTR